MADKDLFQPPSRTVLQHLRDEISASLVENPQKGRLAQLALSDLESGLARLSSLGFHFHLEEGAQGAPPPWPKIMYHYGRAPLGRSVLDKWELAELGQGWATTPQEAAKLYGSKVQAEGRGGIRQPGLPVVITEVGEAPRSK